MGLFPVRGRPFYTKAVGSAAKFTQILQNGFHQGSKEQGLF